MQRAPYREHRFGTCPFRGCDTGIRIIHDPISDEFRIYHGEDVIVTVAAAGGEGGTAGTIKELIDEGGYAYLVASTGQAIAAAIADLHLARGDEP